MTVQIKYTQISNTNRQVTIQKLREKSYHVSYKSKATEGKVKNTGKASIAFL